MKKLILVSLSMVFAISIFAQSPHNILRKYKNNDGVMSVKFEGDVLDLLKNELSENEGKEIKSELEYMDIIVFREGTSISEADKVKLKNALASENYELLINVKDGKNKVKILGLSNGDTISKVFVNADTEKFNVYMVIKGEIYFEDLKNLDLGKIDNMF